MEESKAGFDIMNLLAQSAAKINAMEDPKVIERKKVKIEMQSSSEYQDTGCIVYQYLQGVSPTIASTLLDINPEVNTSCNFTLEEVVQAWKIKEVVEKRALGVYKVKAKAKKKLNLSKNPVECGESKTNDNSKTKTAKKVSKDSKGDIDNGVAMEALDVNKTTLETKMPSTKFCLDTVSIVYNYLQGVNPTLASLLLEIHPEVGALPCNNSLEEVVLKYLADQTDERRTGNVSQLNFKVKEKVVNNKNPIEGRKLKANNIDTVHEETIIKNGHDKSVTKAENVISIKDVNDSVEAKRTLSKGSLKVFRAFTPKEDEIIRIKLEEMGDDLNIKELAEEIGRNYGSVLHRVNKLKSGDGRRKQKSFSLAEDEAIMEIVLPGLHENKLHDLFLHKDRYLEDLATALGRPNKAVSLAHRWVRNLQPWIMQHYAGTVNLDFRLMLVNHLGEAYPSRESIDWDAVAAKSEFFGNTALNLQCKFNQVIRRAKKSLTTESSWEQIIGRCREYISQSRRYNSKESELRRNQVIQYFENYVTKHDIDNFL